MNPYENIRVIAFDADDTLWDNQSHYDAVEAEYCRIMAPFADEKTVRQVLYGVERDNMPLLGYGTKAFMISLIQNALEMTDNKIDGARLYRIVQMGLDLLQTPGEPFEGVKDTLEQLSRSGRFKLVAFTKGDLLDQENKLHRSGLFPIFDHVQIVSEKKEKEYLQLCDIMKVKPDEFLMVGNSFKSDIHPVLEIGGWGIHIPFKRMWQYEHIEEYSHPRMQKISQFRDLIEILLN